MQTIKLEVEESKVDLVLAIIKNLKEDIISRYEVLKTDQETKEFMALSNQTLDDIWNNKEDEIYDKYFQKWYCNS